MYMEFLSVLQGHFYYSRGEGSISEVRDKIITELLLLLLLLRVCIYDVCI